MTEQVNVKVNPTPIQRNKHDVAFELLTFHAKYKRPAAEEIELLYAKYYALADYCENVSVVNLQKLLSDELKAKVVELKEYNPSF
ncbi:hypothetical protein M3936_03770 [Sutcliffiella horikoshii]|uniref:hypothetical protein n=1 Tax=Sutcliffiella horikoshii TaxID=79883 RepID=UPI00203BB2FD|nr:hypothetical protein [Sutcliffiella horikoshii]MCM3616695.1 hypothetical protein [Sutcliffiella horikoshii]